MELLKFCNMLEKFQEDWMEDTSLFTFDYHY